MKIAYLVFGGVNSENGIIKKICSQIRVWQSSCHEAKLFAMSRSEKLYDGLAGLPMESVKGFTKLSRLLKSHRLIKQVIDWKPDIVYIRLEMNWPGLGILLKRVPCIFELNTYDIGEVKHWGCPNIQRYYYLMTRRRLLKRARGVVAVTHEIGDKYAEFAKPTLVLGNGIDLSRHPELEGPNNPVPRLVFIGTPRYPWHGIDKILLLADHFKGWHFDLIGISPDEVKLIPVPENVSMYGYLEHTQYQKIMARADVALGTLALHRNSMDEACTLKVREYLACGIPTIIGYKETDFPKPVSWLLQIPNSPDNVSSSLSVIEKFVHESIGKRVPRKEIQNLDVAFKEKSRLEFMERILENGRINSIR